VANLKRITFLFWGISGEIARAGSFTLMRRIIIQKHRMPQLGEGLVPWDEYIATLRAFGYGGWYALEDETGKDVIDSLKRGGAFLERY
jgi:sugar phosphate isomerase/epimerase